jgi:hypothetical protein
MSTRTIVTSQPDVACELCSRRLLRGETHEVFLADGRARNVCELCAPRAADAGWLRERDGAHTLGSLPTPRRGRGIFERLRLGSRGGEAAHAGRAHERAGRQQPAHEQPPGGETLRVDVEGTVAEWVERTPAPGELRGPRTAPASSPGEAALGGDPGSGSSALQSAAEVFNESEFPRRVAALARSLGAPEVCLRPAEHLDSAVRLTVAWELCWYRYEVDLAEQPPTARAIAQGTELSQLPREERHANAHASSAGTLSL